MSGVSTSGHASAAFTILSLHCAHDIAWGLEGGHGESWDADLPADVTRLKANHASGKETQAHGEREKSSRRQMWSKKVGDGGLPPICILW
jgi:hypothetical protein